MNKNLITYFRTLCILGIMCLFAGPMIKSCRTNANNKPEIYDTIYIVSKYRYYVVDDSTLRKRIVNDTIHTLDTVMPEFPIETVRIIRIDTIK